MIYMVTTNQMNSYVGKLSYLVRIRLDKDVVQSNNIKSQIKKLKVGEAVQFPNGLKVKCVSDVFVNHLVTYLRAKNKDRLNNANHNVTYIWLGSCLR